MECWKVPYVNYKAQTKVYGSGIINEIKRVMAGGDYILRKDVEDFEANLAKFIGARHCIGVNSCTDAMRLVLRVLCKPQKEIIVSGHTFLATLDAIVDANCTPVLVDAGKDYNMDVSLIEKVINKNTIAIMPVHLNGRVCEMGTIKQLAHKYQLMIVEDSAQALGAKYKGQCAGTFGIASCFSFFPAKLLGTIGDAGAICTNDKALADKLRAMRDYGRVRGQEQVVCYGQNSRLDNVHAAILNYKLQFVLDWIKRRREIASIYNRRLEKRGVSLPPSPSRGDFFDIFQNYAIRVKNRDSLIKYLEENGVEVLVHWRTPLNHQKALGFKCKLPETEKLCDEVISLPMYQELSDAQVNYVCDKIIEWVAKKNR